MGLRSVGVVGSSLTGTLMPRCFVEGANWSELRLFAEAVDWSEPRFFDLVGAILKNEFYRAMLVAR